MTQARQDKSPIAKVDSAAAGWFDLYLHGFVDR
jgi:hypothetical protein